MAAAVESPTTTTRGARAGGSVVVAAAVESPTTTTRGARTGGSVVVVVRRAAGTVAPEVAPAGAVAETSGASGVVVVTVVVDLGSSSRKTSCCSSPLRPTGTATSRTAARPPARAIGPSRPGRATPVRMGRSMKRYDSQAIVMVGISRSASSQRPHKPDPFLAEEHIEREVVQVPAVADLAEADEGPEGEQAPE